MSGCEHPDFEARVDVSRLHSEGDVHSFAADITVRCSDCGVSFGFRCPDVGLLPDRPACSPDALELRVPLISPSELELLGPLAALREAAEAESTTERPVRKWRRSYLYGWCRANEHDSLAWLFANKNRRRVLRTLRGSPVGRWVVPHSYKLGNVVRWRGARLICTRDHYAGHMAVHPWDPGWGWPTEKARTLWTPAGPVSRLILRLVGPKNIGQPEESTQRGGGR